MIESFLAQILLAVTTVGLGVAGYFLKGVAAETRKLRQDFHEHELENEHRFTKLEAENG